MHPAAPRDHPFGQVRVSDVTGCLLVLPDDWLLSRSSELSQTRTGVTVLRRLVPAWFFKGELYLNSKGKLHYEIGFAIEF